MQPTTQKASSVCHKVGNPSESTAGVLSKLFNKATPSTGSRKRSFDPSSACVVAGQLSKKKATNQRMKVKKIIVVLMKERPTSVPKGYARKKLKQAGRIANTELKRCMSSLEVRDAIVEVFPAFQHVESAEFLCCGQDNVMLLNEQQELDGDEAINLAGQGSLYLVQEKVNVRKLMIKGGLLCSFCSLWFPKPMQCLHPSG